MRNREHAEILLRKADQDIFVLERLIGDPAAPDEILGFHVQQAAEKVLKAVLTNRAIRYGRTHDLTELIKLIRQNQISFPDELEAVRRLNPYGVRLRYAEATSYPPFDRSWALDIVGRVKAWAESLLREKT